VKDGKYFTLGVCSHLLSPLIATRKGGLFFCRRARYFLFAYFINEFILVYKNENDYSFWASEIFLREVLSPLGE
jgi:hypothetical protein